MTSLTAPTPSLRTSGALAGTLAGVLVAASALLPVPAVAVVFLALSGFLAWGWPRLINLPSPRGTASVIALTAFAMLGVLLATPPDHRTRWAGAVLCVGLIGSFLHQLLRQDGRPRLVFSLAGTALGIGILGSGSYLVASHDNPHTRDLFVAAGLAVALGAVIDGVAGQTQRRIELGIGQTIVGGLSAAATVPVTGVPAWAAILTGAVSALIAWSTLRTVVTLATSAHRRAQYSAGSAMALIVCFVPFAVSYFL